MYVVLLVSQLTMTMCVFFQWSELGTSVQTERHMGEVAQ